MTESPRLRVICDRCGTVFPEDTQLARCGCGGLLAVHHTPRTHGQDLRASFDDNALPHLARSSGVWRFGEIVQPLAATDAISHPEGNTPLMTRRQLSAYTGIDNLMIKHEGHNPTGSFKDRGMTVAVTQAGRIGARAVACASTGNTAASLAAYAAQAGLPALVFVPEGHVAIGKLAQSLAYGARTLVVQGDFDACLRLVQESAAALGLYLVNSINPYRIEGQKTIVLELLRQLEWQAPDWIVVPAGNLGNTAAFGKALEEAHAWGLIDRLPRIAAVQASGAAPFADAYHRDFDRLLPVEAETLATAIRIGAPASYDRAVRSIRVTNGVVTAVGDRDILAAKAAIDRAGIGAEPASAAAVAGARSLAAAGTIGRGERCAVILTGHLLKDPAIITRMHQEPGLIAEPNPPIAIAATVAAVEAALADSRFGLGI